MYVTCVSVSYPSKGGPLENRHAIEEMFSNGTGRCKFFCNRTEIRSEYLFKVVFSGALLTPSSERILLHSYSLTGSILLNNMAILWI